jgi:hypothetical protein
MWLLGSGLCKQQSLTACLQKLGEQKLPDAILFLASPIFFYGYCIYEIANETADGVGQVPTGNHRDSKYRSDKKSDLTTIINE